MGEMWEAMKEMGKKGEFKKSKFSKDKDLTGIDGWLILPVMGNYFAILYFLYYVSISIIFLPLLIFDIVIIYYTAKKKKFAPMLQIIWLSLLLAVVLIGAIISSDGSAESLGRATGSILPYLIWIWYWKVSKRVKNTFVNK